MNAREQAAEALKRYSREVVSPKLDRLMLEHLQAYRPRPRPSKPKPNKPKA